MLTSLYDGLFFVGKLSFQIMKGLGDMCVSQATFAISLVRLSNIQSSKHASHHLTRKPVQLAGTDEMPIMRLLHNEMPITRLLHNEMPIMRLLHNEMPIMRLLHNGCCEVRHHLQI
jgi:hypothetical protein